MKKFISLFLCFLQLWILPVYAEINLKQNKPYQGVIYLQNLPSATIKNTPPVPQVQKGYDIKVIDYNKNTEENMCKLLNISKKEIKLKSYLKDHGKAYIYILKNNSQETILIKDIKNIATPERIIAEKKYSRHKNLNEKWQNVQTSTKIIPIGIILLPFMPVVASLGCLNYLDSNGKSKTNGKLLLWFSLLPIAAIGYGIGYPIYVITSTPYTIISGKVKDQHAKVESNKIKSYKFPVKIDPGSESEFLVVEGKLKKIQFIINNPTLTKEYCLEK